MKILSIILFSLLFLTNIANAESRFGELTEMRDKKMRGKDGDCVLAAVVYLDPNPNINAGTSTYRIKDEYLEDGKFKYDEHPDYSDDKMLKVRYDATRTIDSCKVDSGKQYEVCLRNNNKHFEKTLEVKNFYNRVIIYDGDKFHGQTSIYKDNGFRLTNIFFFYEIVSPFVHIPKWRCELDGI